MLPSLLVILQFGARLGIGKTARFRTMDLDLVENLRSGYAISIEIHIDALAIWIIEFAFVFIQSGCMYACRFQLLYRQPHCGYGHIKGCLR